MKSFRIITFHLTPYDERNFETIHQRELSFTCNAFSSLTFLCGFKSFFFHFLYFLLLSFSVEPFFPVSRKEWKVVPGNEAFPRSYFLTRLGTHSDEYSWRTFSASLHLHPLDLMTLVGKKGSDAPIHLNLNMNETFLFSVYLLALIIVIGFVFPALSIWQTM